MTPIYLDTHVLLWLYNGDIKRLSKKIHKQIAYTPLAYSPVARLELQYLQEIGRVSASPHSIIKELQDKLVFAASSSSFSEVCNQAENIGWTRDVFDRLIVADAMVASAPLVTADQTILQNYKHAIW